MTAVATGAGLWAKATRAAYGAAAAAAITALADGHVDFDEGLTIAVAGLVALSAVQFIANATTGPLVYYKAIITGLISGAGTLTANGVGNSLTAAGWVALGLSVVNAFLVALTPDALVSDRLRDSGRVRVPRTPS